MAKIFLEYLLCGGILSLGRLLGLGVYLHVVEEDGTHLRGRADVELLAGHGVDLLFHLRNLVLEPRAHLQEGRGVDAYACPLHFGQHAHQGEFNVGQQRSHLPLCHLGLEGARRRRLRSASSQ